MFNRSLRLLFFEGIQDDNTLQMAIRETLDPNGAVNIHKAVDFLVGKNLIYIFFYFHMKLN